MFPAGFVGMDGRLRLLRSRCCNHRSCLVRSSLELRAREQTGGAIRALLKLTPRTAHRLKASGEDEEVAIELIQV